MAIQSLVICPNCGKYNDSLSGVDKSREEILVDGAVIICIACGFIQIFKGEGLIPLTTQMVIDEDNEESFFQWLQNLRAARFVRMKFRDEFN